MKRLLSLLLLFPLLCVILPAHAGDGASIFASMPEEIAAFFMDSKYSDCTISANAYIALENTPGGSFAFVVTTSDAANTLYGFRRENGKWAYYLKTASALPQEKGVFFLSNAKGTQLNNTVISQDMLEIGLQLEGVEEYWSFWEFFAVNSAGQWQLRQIESYLPGASVFASVSETGIHYYGDVSYLEDAPLLQAVEGTVETNLRYFDWSAFPKSPAQAESKLSTPPTLPASSELIAQNVKLTGGQKFPVYSGPGEWYLRGANGKAVVSTNDWIQVFGVDSDYLLIQYAVSSDHMRFGYITASAAPELVSSLDFSYAAAYVTEPAALTDDPLYSRQSLGMIQEGQQVQWLAIMGDYVYVETRLSDQPVRGFLPKDAVKRRAEETERTASGQFSSYSAFCTFTLLENNHFYAVVNTTRNSSAKETETAITSYMLYANQIPVTDYSCVANGWSQDANGQWHQQFVITGSLPAGAALVGFCPVRQTLLPAEMLIISLQ